MLLPVVIVGGIGLVCSVILVIAAKVMAMPADELFDAIRAELQAQTAARADTQDAMIMQKRSRTAVQKPTFVSLAVQGLRRQSALQWVL